MNSRQSKQLKNAIRELSDFDSLKKMRYDQCDSEAMPSSAELEEIVGICRSILFPGFFGNPSVNEQNLNYHIGLCTERLFGLLCRAIRSALCFQSGQPDKTDAEVERLACGFVAQLPALRDMLADDVIASYNGDPAAESLAEVISCYPGIRAISSYRIAHALFALGVPIIPRMITELAHSETGIDIHPAASIGRSFSIDHGTGVVIGATAILGNNVKLYQGVTLGAKSFPLDGNGNPIKGVPRHPILEDNVIVYSNATILGRVTVGHDAVIGGNIWITADVAPETKVVQTKRTTEAK